MDGSSIGFPIGTIILFGAFAAIAIAIVLIGRHLAAKRRARLQAWASAHGLVYTPRNDDLARRWDKPPFDMGRSRYATDIFTGVYRGSQIVSFAYQYTVDSGSGSNRSSTTYHFHIVGVSLPRMLPYFEMSPETMMSRLAGKLGMRDIQFESPEFNREWRVSAADERFAYGVVNPQFMEWSMNPALHGMLLRLDGADCLTSISGRQRLETIFPTLDVLLDFVARIPRHVWDDYGR